MSPEFRRLVRQCITRQRADASAGPEPARWN